MELGRALSQLPNATRLDGLHSGWRWSPAPGIDFALVVACGGRHLFQMATRDAYDPGLCQAVLDFVQARANEICDNTRSIIALRGFSHPGYRFDAVGALPPSRDRAYVGRGSPLDPMIVPVFPAYHFEFGGEESAAEVAYRFDRVLRTADIARDPSPFLKMAYRNHRTGSRTAGEEREIASVADLYFQLSTLEGAPDSFVEFENWQGKVCKVESRDGLLVAEGGVTVRMALADLTARAEELIFAD